MSSFLDRLKSLFGGADAADGPMHFELATVTDRGLSRADNQDSFFVNRQSCIFAVADGMGGGQGGAFASEWICEELKNRFDVPEGSASGLRVGLADEALQAANARIREYAAANEFKSMGSTAVVLMADPGKPSRAAVAHVGDSRIYRWRKGKGTLLTRDHTVGNELGSAFANQSQAKSLQSRRNPLAHVLTRAVGIGFKVRAEWRKIDIHPGDRYLLCTDGVHDVLSDEQVAALMGRAKTPAQAVAAVTEKVVACGAPDNYTIVCVFAVRD